MRLSENTKTAILVVSEANEIYLQKSVGIKKGLAISRKSLFYLVAGAGFEPTTFGL
jgi:hypothetical protein